MTKEMMALIGVMLLIAATAIYANASEPTTANKNISIGPEIEVKSQRMRKTDFTSLTPQGD